MNEKSVNGKEAKRTEAQKQHEKGINLRIQECKENIAAAINNAKLPPGILQMILSEFATQVQMQNAQAIAQERKFYEEGVKEDGSKHSKSNN